jgi:Flp pilus assembly protein TadD
MMQAYVYGRSGRQQQARRALEKLEDLNRRQPLDAAFLICAHIGVGNTEAAFTWFEKAYLQHSNALTSLRVNPLYDPLRSDPRFQDMLRRVGLAQ